MKTLLYAITMVALGALFGLTLLVTSPELMTESFAAQLGEPDADEVKLVPILSTPVADPDFHPALSSPRDPPVYRELPTVPRTAQNIAREISGQAQFARELLHSVDGTTHPTKNVAKAQELLARVSKLEQESQKIAASDPQNIPRMVAISYEMSELIGMVWTPSLWQAPSAPSVFPTLLEQSTQSLLREYSAASTDTEREEVKVQLLASLDAQFVQRQAARDGELAEVENRVKALREKWQQRETERARIVNDRLQQLLNESQGLGWVVGETPVQTPKKRDVLYFFHKYTSGPSQQNNLKVDSLIREGMPIEIVDVDQPQELVTRFNVQMVPTFVLVYQGQEVDRRVGSISESDIRQMASQVGVAREPTNRFDQQYGSATLLSPVLGPAIRVQPTKLENGLFEFTNPLSAVMDPSRPIAAKLIKEGLPLRSLDINKVPHLVERHKIVTTPTFVLILNGQEVERKTGSATEAELLAMLVRARLLFPAPNEPAAPVVENFAAPLAPTSNIDLNQMFPQYRGTFVLEFAEVQQAKDRNARPIVEKLKAEGWPIHLVEGAERLRLANYFDAGSPEFLLIMDGHVMDRLRGTATEESLRQLIKRIDPKFKITRPADIPGVMRGIGPPVVVSPTPPGA